jgi:hypothetical protein
MKQNRMIFYSVFGAILLGLTLFSFFMYSSRNDFSILSSVLKIMWMFPLCATVLLVMYLFGIMLQVRDYTRSKRLTDAQQREIIELKAKLYDKAQAVKAPSPNA